MIFAKLLEICSYIIYRFCPEFIKLYVKSYTSENTPSQYISTHFEEEDPTAITNGLL